ncbi:delta-lactam-biosynthetic de-N-acetylase [Desulfotomaculum copahuensis]|uniref:Delta-lactam-biosynthetic de-N-acetylase n=1 Tax=Desulfotomaculum copahuensis TaxID=1838280 RepID=A0A1B7LAI1_9FIRM|nr:delta-lactam-biosynthetic de-N-acetylase [Desulfotomaculum copahuensis]OAT79336.1 delta-lactam-biosynthetic de-N-acetylase [Desulfotomaculum copahuensis]
MKKYTWLIILGLLVIVAASAVYAGKMHRVPERTTAGSVYQAPAGHSPGLDTQKQASTPDANMQSAGRPLKKNGQPPAAVKTTTGLSNVKHGWGIKRNDNHQQPEMPSGISSTLARYGAWWIGKPDEKTVYLTFDEGYENGYTPKILDILKADNVRAAFFVTGHYIKSQPELVKRMVAEGHTVGNHTMNHPSLPEIGDGQIKTELQSVETMFNKLTGQQMHYLRPPKGEYSERTLALTRELGYHNIFWSLALVDWVPMPGGPEEAYRSVMDNLHPGALILLHAVSKDDTEALDRMIKDIRAQGYSFKTLDDLVKGK